MKKPNIKLSFSSPVILGFTFVCFAAFILDMMTSGWANYVLFSVYRSSLLDPFTYIRFFGHAVGHAGWEHFCGNIMMILVIGPLLEEKYGSKNILFIILVVALLTGIVHFMFFPSVRLLGASGVVFAMILLSAFAGIRDSEIPLTLILVALFYIGGQIYQGLFVASNVSNLTHVIGGVTGASLGFVMHKNKMNRY